MIISPIAVCMPGKPTHISFSPQFYDIFINCLKDAIELAKSEILNDGSGAIAPILTEGLPGHWHVRARPQRGGATHGIMSEPGSHAAGRTLRITGARPQRGRATHRIMTEPGSEAAGRTLGRI